MVRGLPHRRAVRGLACAVFACAAVAAGCGSESDVASSAGALPVWTVGPSPSLSIGELEGDSAHTFSGIAAVRLLPGDRVLVADRSSGTLRIFDGAGRLERQMGRLGEGPGEFAWLGEAFPLGFDTVGAYDSRTQRLTTFLVDGSVSSTLEFHAPDGFPEMYLGRYADGSHALAWIKQVQRDMSTPTPDLMKAGRFNPDGTLSDLLVTDVGMRRVEFVSGYLRVSPVPFSPHFLAAMVGDTVFHTDGLNGRIVATGTAGDTIRVLRVPGEPLDAESAFRRLEAALDSAAVGRLEALRGRPGLDTVPTISDMLADEDGHLWLKRYAPETDSHWLGRPRTGGEWLVVETDGTPVARVVIPAGLRLMVVGGDRLAGVVRDDLGVERVWVYALDRG